MKHSIDDFIHEFEMEHGKHELEGKLMKIIHSKDRENKD